MFHKFCILNGHTTTHCKLTVGQLSEHNVVSGLHLANFVFRVPSDDFHLYSNFDQILFWGLLAGMVRAKRVLVIKTIPRHSFVLSALDQWRSLLSLLFIVRSSTKMDIHYVVCACLCPLSGVCLAVAVKRLWRIISMWSFRPSSRRMGQGHERRERRRVQRSHSASMEKLSLACS